MQKKTARPDSQLLRWEEELMGLIKAKVLAETETSMWAQTNMSIEESESAAPEQRNCDTWIR